MLLRCGLAIEGETIATKVSCFRAPRCLGCSGGRRVRECLAIYPLSHSACLGQIKGEDMSMGEGEEMAFLSFLPSLALMAVWNASATIGIPFVGAPCVGCVPLAAWDFVGRPYK
jgi:hypothetical protein